MNLLTEWKEDKGHTMREMGRRIGVSSYHICRVMQGKKNLGKETRKRLKEVQRYEHLISCDPVDKILLEYELEQLIGGY